MANPAFVMTSKGMINAAAIVHIALPTHGSITCYFAGGTESGGEETMNPYTVSLPQEEGARLVDLLRERRPEWFIGDVIREPEKSP